MKPVIDIHDLQVNYESTVALKHVDLTIYDKEFIGIIGPNGGGKTTLVKAILGLVEPKQGEVKLEEHAIIGYVPQLTTFDRGFPITVEEVILTGHLPKKIKMFKKFSIHEQNHAHKVMTRLGIEHLKKRQIGALSGGQMQRVLIARALMNHPTILILDEPTAGVDQQAKKDIYAMLKELNQEITIIMVTHDTDILMDYLKRVVYINKRVHIHSDNSNYQEGEYCPIDWYIQGEEIQRDLVKDADNEEEKRNLLKESHTYD